MKYTYNFKDQKAILYRPVKRGALPYEVDNEVGGAVQRSARAALELEPDVVAVVVGHLDHVAHARPRLVELADVSTNKHVNLEAIKINTLSTGPEMNPN